MGNAMGRRRRRAKVMTVDGETFKFNTPARASDVVKDYPGYVLLDSEAVKNFGLRAKPLESQQELKPNKIYFLLELPKVDDSEKHRLTRVRSSGFHGTAKEKLELLMLSRRSVSDISFARARSMSLSDVAVNGPGLRSGPMSVKMRLPKAQFEKLREESRDQSDVVEKIMKIYSGNDGGKSAVTSGSSTPADGHSGVLGHPGALRMAEGDGNRMRQKARETFGEGFSLFCLCLRRSPSLPSTTLRCLQQLKL